MSNDELIDVRGIDYIVKDSGKRTEFDSGMVRDTTEGKTQYHRVFEGPMLDRWAEHLTKGAEKYPDLEDGSANWTLANGEAELRRFTQSAVRHFRQWLRGDVDEDHASAVFFNLNGAEYVKARIREEQLEGSMSLDELKEFFFPNGERARGYALGGPATAKGEPVS